MIAKGTANVRIEVIGFNGSISSSMPLTKEALAKSEYKVANTQTSMQLSRFLVQIGAFRKKEGAQKYQQMHSTSHGYQANNFFYLGGGTGVHIYSQYGALVPFFANLRINILNKKITPVIDCKVGYSVGRFYGTYFSGTIGLRFSLGGKKAVYALGELLSIQMDDRCDESYGKIGIVGYGLFAGKGRVIL